MRGATRKVLVGFLVVFMVFLIALTSVTTVTAQDGWGTLKAGDEMQWQSNEYGTVKMKVINVDGDTITLEVTVGGNTETEILDADAHITQLNIADVTPWLLPKLQLEEDYNFPTQNYEFENTTYRVYYSELSSGRKMYYDFNTGILFEDISSDGTTTDRLVSTNADLAESTGSYGTDTGSCLGTLLIVLVSVTTVVSYSVLRKKKKH